MWDARIGLEALTLQGHSGPVWSVAFSPDGQRLVSGGGSFSPDGQRLVKRLVRGGAAFGPDGNRIASGGRTAS